MWRATILTSLVLTSMAWLPVAAAQGIAAPPPCIDAVAIGNVITQDTDYAPADPDAWLDPVPWTIVWRRQRVLAGPPLSLPALPARLTTVFDSHAGIGEQVPHVLLLLQRVGHRWWLVDARADVVRDSRGRFVLPVFAPLNAYEEALPWMPRDWRARLRPIQYDARHYAWLDAGGREPSEPEDQWIRVSRGRVIARQGLVLDEMPEFRAVVHATNCVRGPPEYWPEELRADRARTRD